MQLKTLKLAIVANEWKHQALADAVNRHLPRGLRLSENAITRVVTGRKRPSPEQATALARVLGRTVPELFPPEGRDHEQG
ncbi:MAG: helix-turn-helix transcriptional regulator [Lentisphaerae bacterium]|jgi:transcriptional regulator with XRE-family HTH domain|nr:helix-turn-helix transcriptional regulator [Lentisphaerota bacterium]